MIYDVQGNEISSAYAINGGALSQAYDVQGNELIDDGFVVMSYNVQWMTGINSDMTMQASILNTYNPDVIGFQEFQKAVSSQMPSWVNTLLPDYQTLMGNYGNKNGIASKYTMSNFTTVPFTTQTMDGQSYSTATITVNGKEIFLVDAHLTTSDYEATKVEQAGEVFDALQGHEYFILMGDFNTVCKSVNDTEYTTLMKRFVDAGYNVANCSPQHGFNDTWTGGSTASGTWYPCDHIITSANITIDEVIVDTQKISVAEQTGQSIDHLPIIARLTII